MWNDTELAPEGGVSSSVVSSGDESSYSIFFSSYNPDSPVYSNNLTDLGVSLGMLKFCIEGIGIMLVGVLGIIGNIISIIVLSSKRMRNSSSCFLLCLAICDIVTLFGAILLVGVPSILTYDPTDEALFVFNKNIVAYGNIIPSAGLFAVAVTALSGSIFFTMALTLERYLAVCKPLYARHLCTWTRASIVSAIIIIITILFNLPRWWEFSYVVEKTINNLTFYRPLPTKFRMNPIYDTYYVHISFVVLQFLVPITSLIIFNILIYREIKQANALRKTMSPSQKHEISLTRILFGVVFIFLFCYILPAIHASYRYVMGSRNFVPEAEFVWTFMLMLNSSLNFVVYCTTGAKFRETFCDMLCFWKTGDKIRRFTLSHLSTKTTSLSFSTSFKTRSYSVQNPSEKMQNSENAVPVFIAEVP